MKTKILAAAAALAFATAAPVAHAAIWTTQLEYDPALLASLGTVTINEVSSTELDITLALNSGFPVDTGGHFVFAFNLDDDVNNIVKVLAPANNDTNIPSYVYMNTAPTQVCTGHGPSEVCTPSGPPVAPPYTNAPFGDFHNAFSLNPDGGNHLGILPFTFSITNVNGITFAGTGEQSVNGHLGGTLGGGTNLFSNGGGWWFSVDTSGTDGHCSPTCVIAGRDATTGVPEPMIWGMMVIGFGGLGALLRRRRTLAAA